MKVIYKKVIAAALLVLVFTVLLYGFFSFYFVSFDFAKWSEGGRAAFCLCEVVIMFFCGLVFTKPD